MENEGKELTPEEKSKLVDSLVGNGMPMIAREALKQRNNLPCNENVLSYFTKMGLDMQYGKAKLSLAFYEKPIQDLIRELGIN